MRLFQKDKNIRLDVRRSGRLVAATLVAGAAGAAGLGMTVPAAQAGVANRGLPGAGSDPIANMTWGVARNDDIWNAYQASKGAKHALLGKLENVPRTDWLGYWIGVRQIKSWTAQVVTGFQNGNPNALAAFNTFELHPWDTAAGHGVWHAPTKGVWNVKSDEAWYRNMAAGIGKARAMVIVQADLPFDWKLPSPVPAQINSYAVKTLAALPRTTVYIDGGTFGWLKPEHLAKLLVSNGIRNARGFALDDTDYDPTATEDKFGATVVQDLAKLGVPGKHFIVDTDENGQPYKPQQVKLARLRGINDAPPCHGSIQTVCQRTGILPTTNVASPKWRLGAAASAAAKRYCDAYIWSGRPWDVDGGPYRTQYALWLAANGQYKLPPVPVVKKTATTTSTTTTPTTTTTAAATTTTGTGGTAPPAA